MIHLMVYGGFRYQPVTACRLYWPPALSEQTYKPADATCPECRLSADSGDRLFPESQART